MSFKFPKEILYDGETLLQEDFRPMPNYCSAISPTSKPYESESQNDLSALEKAGKLIFRQALLEIILGEETAKDYFSKNQPHKDKATIIDTLEHKLKKGLHWGVRYLESDGLVTRVQKPTISTKPTKMRLPNPKDFVASQKEAFNDSIAKPYKQWKALANLLEKPELVKNKLATTRLNRLLTPALALYVFFYQKEYPNDWSTSRDKKTFKLNENERVLMYGDISIRLSASQFRLAMRIVKAGKKGLSRADYESLYLDLNNSNNVAPDFSKEVSRLNATINKVLGKNAHLMFFVKGISKGSYQLNPKLNAEVMTE